MRWNLDWKPRRVFYGWWIVVACFFISLYVGGVVFYGFTTLIEPLADDFGWSYTQISFAASLRGMEMGILAPLVGMLVDRWGPRRLLFGGLIITSLGLMLLSRTTSLGMFYGAFVLMAIGMSTCSSTVLMTAVANWFRRKIGIATGIMICGYGFSGLLIPVIVNLIDTYEWRMTLALLTIGLLAICLPLSLLVRHKPEQYGYQPDGEAENTVILNNSLAKAKVDEVNVGTKQAVKSRTFWHIALALMCQFIILSAVITHVMPYLSSIGFTRAISGLMAAGIPLASIGGRLGLGWLGDKVDKRRVAAGAFALMCGGLLCFGFISAGDTWLLVTFLILFGIGYGGNNTLRASLIREFFGRKNFGAIHGLMIGVMALGSIAGPPLAGYVFDNWGSYQPIWFVFAGLAIAALLAVITTPPVSSTVQPVDET
ncbi:MAG TPA: MFS transporter [Dehalococcoidia bacterium]|nr:MFS transporter [Dehalococcoidia bacterium]